MTSAQVLICEGCEIGTSLDVPALVSLMTSHPGVAACRAVPCLCNDAGLRVLDDCLAPEPDAVVIGACSPRVHVRRLSTEGHPGHRIERVNLREFVAWSHPPRDEDTQLLAEDCLRMGVARAVRAACPRSESQPVERRLLVVGGGPTGIAAALGAARAGYGVLLVEREAELGGWLRQWRWRLPSRPPFRELETVDLPGVLGELASEPSISVRVNARVRKITGAPGQFDVELDVGGECVTERVGAIVQATGFQPYDATRLPHLGYGRSANIVTNVEFEQLLAAGKLPTSAGDQVARRIAFVQCAGSRDPEHLAHCSSVCCRVTLKQALLVRELDPEVEAYVLARDLRAAGLHEAFYRRAQEDPGISFLTTEVTRVQTSDTGSLVVEMKPGPFGSTAELEVDLVVLAMGMVPVAVDGEVLRQLRDTNSPSPPEGTLDARGAGSPGSQTPILHLGYRQGPDLPDLRGGFPDSRFVCFPYETRRTGIYAAGCARAPNDVEACRGDGEGAALKAIQAIEATATGTAVHPRWGDQTVPRFALQRCTQCKRCTEECPFGTLDEDDKGTPLLNLSRCRRCGICLGACPERVISFADYSIDVVSSMIQAVHVPDEFEEKPRILVILCENDAYPALDLAGFHRRQHSAFIRTVGVRCLGSVNVVWIADALAHGFDGVLLLGCKAGEDTQCHFVRGSDLMQTRTENVRQKLEQLALEEERVRVEHVALSEYLAVPELIDDFVRTIEELGMNPFKGA